MIQDLDLYYTAPSDKVFSDIKKKSIAIWRAFSRTEKVDEVKKIENIKDNAMFIFAMFDIHNQATLLMMLTEESRKVICKRLPEDYYINYLQKDLKLFKNIKNNS